MVTGGEREVRGSLMWERVQYDEMSSCGRLRVVDRGNQRTLYLGSLPQTTIDLREPDRLVARYIRYMHLGMVFRPDSEKVAFLGLGGGAGIRSFHQGYPEMRITAVDIDADVVDVARRYFFVEEDERLSVVVEDGRRFVTEHEAAFDQIILDAYSQDGYPSRMYTRESFQLMRHSLRDSEDEESGGSGVLVINAVGWLKGERSYSLQVIMKTLRAVFPSVYLFEVARPFLARILGGGGSNFILVASGDERTMSRRLLRYRAERAQRELGPPVDLRPLVPGFRPLPALHDVPVLTDRLLQRGQLRLTV